MHKKVLKNEFKINMKNCFAVYSTLSYIQSIIAFSNKYQF